METATLLDKYGEIIAQEVNVKEVTALNADLSVTKIFVPIGQEVSSKYGKDTGQIIAAAKQGNVDEHDDGTISVYQGENSRKLTPADYEIRYEGLDTDKYAIEGGVIVHLDTHMTDELKQEGVARELSRFLNQLRKEADYQVDQRVSCIRSSEDAYIQEVINTYSDMLKQEALLTSIKAGSPDGGDVTDSSEFSAGTVTFTLKA